MIGGGSAGERRVGEPSTSARDRVAVHGLPAREGRVETVFDRRGDAFVSSALTAFMDLVRTRHGAQARPEAA